MSKALFVLEVFQFLSWFLVVWQCHKNDPDANITDSKSFKFQTIMTIKNLVGDNTKVTHCTKKMKFSIKNFFSKCDHMWQHPQETADLVTFTEEILNGKHFCAVTEIAVSLMNACEILKIHLINCEMCSSR